MSKKAKFLTFTISVLFLTGLILVSSRATSPLYPNNYQYDSALFRFIGKEIIRRKTPYKDVWDHKGPVLFFIQAIGAWKGTRNAGPNLLFLMQLLSVYVSVFFLYKTWRMLRPDEKNGLRFIFVIVCSYIIYSITCEGGNLTEEWCLPLICLSIYLLIKYFVSAVDSPKHPLVYAFIHGLCIALIAFIRVNNALTICCGLLIIGIYLIKNKEWKNLLWNILFGILGISVVTIPILLWFNARDALSDMIYAVFTFNLKYVQVHSYLHYTGKDFWMRALPILASFIITVLYWLKTRGTKHKIYDFL